MQIFVEGGTLDVSLTEDGSVIVTSYYDVSDRTVERVYDFPSEFVKSIELEDRIMQSSAKYNDPDELDYVLYGGDPDCNHRVESQWSGVKCVKCNAWYCA